MEIKDYVKQFFAEQSDKVERRDLQKESQESIRVADFCRENMLDYYEMVEALKQEKSALKQKSNEAQSSVEI